MIIGRDDIKTLETLNAHLLDTHQEAVDLQLLRGNDLLPPQRMFVTPVFHNTTGSVLQQRESAAVRTRALVFGRTDLDINENDIFVYGDIRYKVTADIHITFGFKEALAELWQ